jgi:hypothetical protein
MAVDESSDDRHYTLLRGPTLRVRHSLCRPAEAVLWLLGAVALIIMIAAQLRAAWQPSAIMMLARGTILRTSSTLPVCLLLHGAGMDTETPIEVSMKGYWGALQERLQWVCSTVVYMYEDTLRVGWEDAALQERVCALVRDAAAIALASTTAPLVIFSHSLGSLLLAGALEAGRCALPAEAAWYSAGAPWQGSRAAEKLPQICSVGRSLDLEGVAAHAASVMLRVLAVRERYCEADGNGPSPGFFSTRASNEGLPALARWQSRLNGSLCGDSAIGLWSTDSLGLEALAELSAFGEANDGAVPTTACHPRGAQVERAHASPHYTAAVNHYDLACRHGDGLIPWGGDDRRPCSWYVAMAGRVASTLSPLASR